MSNTDYIDYQTSGTLSGLFAERIRRSCDKTAYIEYDDKTESWISFSWQQMGQYIARWQSALSTEDLAPGSRVAILLPNGVDWVQFDQAALGLNLIVVPLYMNDRADSVSYILQDAGVQILLIDNLSQWRQIEQAENRLNVQKVIVRSPLKTSELSDSLTDILHYLPASHRPMITRGDPHDVASIVYTSGTTGRPKGVMLSHNNILWNAHSGLKMIQMYPTDHLLSFLPLSHTLERSIGYYLIVMCGASVSFARSVSHLGEDLLSQKPTVFISVPRIFERVYGRIQQSMADKSIVAKFLFKKTLAIGWQRFLFQQRKARWEINFLLWPILKRLVANTVLAKLGGHVRFAIVGGARMPTTVTKLFISLGLPISQGYGLTETSPVISVNPLEGVNIESVGKALDDVEIKIGDNDELLVRGPGVMQGYWHDQEATNAIIQTDGWLHTGDKARIEADYIYITGRLKEIIVLSNGEKVSPNDMEIAICLSPFIEQIMVIGDNRPFLSAIIVLNEDNWPKLAKLLPNTDNADVFSSSIKRQILRMIAEQLHDFPGYADIRAIHLTLELWTVENEMITPTLKLKRYNIEQHYEADINKMYEGH